MIGQWCQIDEKRFCQERDCQGCQIYYLSILDLDKNMHQAKPVSIMNSLASTTKSLDVSPSRQAVLMDDRNIIAGRSQKRTI